MKSGYIVCMMIILLHLAVEFSIDGNALQSCASVVQRKKRLGQSTLASFGSPAIRTITKGNPVAHWSDVDAR
eukprot:2124641-Pleurochrysis_carterae.AAC.2